MRKIVREIAEKDNVSIEEVRLQMQAAINFAYINPNAAALTIPRKSVVPTTREFINHTIKQIYN